MIQAFQLLYFFSLLGALIIGCLMIARDATLLLEYRRRPAMILGGAVLVLTAASLLLGVASRQAGEGGNPLLLPGLLAICILNVLTLLPSLPVAVSWDRADARPWPAAPVFVALLAATFFWSVSSFGIAHLLVEVKMSDEFALKDVGMGKPLEFAMIACFALAAAVMEELIFRGVLQPFLRRQGLPLAAAILIPGAVFAVGHGGYTEPWGVKEIQILGLAVIFGWARERHGLGAAVMLHLANNALALLLAVVAPWLAV